MFSTYGEPDSGGTRNPQRMRQHQGQRAAPGFVARPAKDALHDAPPSPPFVALRFHLSLYYDYTILAHIAIAQRRTTQPASASSPRQP